MISKIDRKDIFGWRNNFIIECIDLHPNEAVRIVETLNYQVAINESESNRRSRIC